MKIQTKNCQLILSLNRRHSLPRTLKSITRPSWDKTIFTEGKQMHIPARVTAINFRGFPSDRLASTFRLLVFNTVAKVAFCCETWTPR